MTDPVTLGILGGSGLYAMSGLVDAHEYVLDTPFGKPSAPLVVGLLEGRPTAFLARHGLGHTLTPTEVNYRANIFAMKMLGVTRLIAISACGSLREDYAPGDMAVPDQLFDFTRRRVNSFFGEGLVAHVGVADPFCPDLSAQLLSAIQLSGAKVHAGGSFITIEGPRFSTKAESQVFRSWGMSLIGMTTSPEAFLAREAGICYAVLAHVTDYDVWHLEEAPVSVEMVIRTLNQNTAAAQNAIRTLARSLREERECSCNDSLSDALITRPDLVPESTRSRLELLAGKYLKSSHV